MTGNVVGDFLHSRGAYCPCPWKLRWYVSVKRWYLSKKTAQQY